MIYPKVKFGKFSIDILLLILAICFTLSFCLWSNHEDLYYWYVLCDYYHEEALVILSLWIAKIWKGVVAGNLFLFNILGGIIGMVSLLIPYLVFQQWRHIKDNLKFLSVGILLAGPIAVGIYTPDVPTTFFIVVLSVLLQKCKVDNVWKLLVVSTISAGAITARFPNVLLLPVCSLFIAYQLSKYESRKIVIGYTVAYILTTIIFYIVIMVLLSGELNVFAFLVSEFVNPISKSDTSHSLHALLLKYIQSGSYYLLSLLPIVLCFFVYYKFKKQRIIKYSTLFVTPILYTYSLYYFLNDLNNYSFVFTHGSFVIIALMLYNIFIRRDKHFSISVLFIVAVGIVTCAGSNTGFQKISPYFASYLPIVLISLKNNNSLNTFVKVVLTILMVMSVTCLFMRKIPHRSIKPWGILYERITDYKYRMPDSSYAGFMEKVDYEMANEGLYYYRKYGNPNHSYFYGNNYSLRLYALSGTRVPYRVPYYFAPDDEIAIGLLIEAMENDTCPVLFDYTNSRIINTRLRKLNYSVVYEDGLVVYMKR